MLLSWFYFWGRYFWHLGVITEQFRNHANCPYAQGRTNRGQLFHDFPLILYIPEYGSEIISAKIIG